MAGTIRVVGEREFSDYLAGCRLARRTRRLVLRMILICLGLVLLADWAAWRRTEPGSWVLAAFGAFFVLCGAFLVEAVLRLRLRRNWSRYPALCERALDITFSEEGVSMPDDAGRPALASWRRFTKWKEDRRVIVLHLSPRMWVSFPKRLVRPSDLEALRDLLREKVGSGAFDRSVPRAPHA
jgi:hypothetical protein